MKRYNSRCSMGMMTGSLCLALFSSFFYLTPLQAEEEVEYTTGLVPMTEEESQEIQANVPLLKKVKPNSLGQDRIQKHKGKKQKKSPKAPFSGPTLGGDGQVLSDDFEELPFEVNNSTLPSFPSIGRQGALNSCVAFATTYYQATHEIGLLNGYNNKESTKHICSPTWTYNLLNGGNNGGIPEFGAYLLLAQSGAPSIEEVPYTDSDYRTWNWGANCWLSAMKSRTATVEVINNLDTDPEAIQTIKQLLNNGHVITFGSYAGSWRYYRNFIADPEGLEMRYRSDFRVNYATGTKGPHFITIVGYNDNIWLDVNENGQVDPGERGAFLLANSWGDNYGTKGFIWISYDAFRAVSEVPGAPMPRVPAAAASRNLAFKLTPKAYNYTPKLAAQFNVTVDQRKSVAIQGGVSDESQTQPTELLKGPFMKNLGGIFQFDGTKAETAQTASFALDFTDWIPETPQSLMQRFYLSLDDVSEAPSYLNSFCLLDLTKNLRIDLPNVPLPFTEGVLYPYLDYNFYCGLSASSSGPFTFIPIDKEPPEAVITSPSWDWRTLSGVYPVTVDATDVSGIDRVRFLMGVERITEVREAPYTILLDTTNFDNGAYTLQVMVFDKAGNYSIQMRKVFIKND